MSRQLGWWPASVIAMVLASGAGAELVPAQPAIPSVPSAVLPLQSLPNLMPVTSAAKKVTTPTVAVPTPTSLLHAVPSNVVKSGTVAFSPSLSAPLGSVQAHPPSGAVASTSSTITPARNGNMPAPSLRTAARAAPALGVLISLIVPPTAAGAATLSAVRTQRLGALVRANPLRVDRDDLGNPVVRGRLLVIDPDTASLERAHRSGFPLVERFVAGDLGLTVVALGVPKGLGTSDALRRLKAVAPRMNAEYDHIFEPAGGELGPTKAKLSEGRESAHGLIGMIDGGVAAHPSLAGRIVAQEGFAGPVRATGHGTAVASLLIGRQGKFRGAASTDSLLVADVYGGQSAAGSASAIARALGWLAARHPQVINVSLVGPANELIRRAVMQVRSRGIPIVAAVGNDGPAAPPQFPASYPGVIAVTGVDAGGAVLFESGNSAHLDFGAPGADMAAARPGKGYVRVRGTSFAAPLAAGRLATVGSIQRLTAEARRGQGVGRGIVCMPCRVDPALVGAR